MKDLPKQKDSETLVELHLVLHEEGSRLLECYALLTGKQLERSMVPSSLGSSNSIRSKENLSSIMSETCILTPQMSCKDTPLHL
jgi:hypothetical protein